MASNNNVAGDLGKENIDGVGLVSDVSPGQGPNVGAMNKKKSATVLRPDRAPGSLAIKGPGPVTQVAPVEKPDGEPSLKHAGSRENLNKAKLLEQAKTPQLEEITEVVESKEDIKSFSLGKSPEKQARSNIPAKNGQPGNKSSSEVHLNKNSLLLGFKAKEKSVENNRLPSNTRINNFSINQPGVSDSIAMPG